VIVIPGVFLVLVALVWVVKEEYASWKKRKEEQALQADSGNHTGE
jgi:hypothetical protein